MESIESEKIQRSSVSGTIRGVSRACSSFGLVSILITEYSGINLSEFLL